MKGGKWTKIIYVDEQTNNFKESLIEDIKFKKKYEQKIQDKLTNKGILYLLTIK